MLEIDSDRLYSDLSKTMDKLKAGSRETFLKEYDSFIDANASMAFNFLRVIKDQNKVFSRREYLEAYRKNKKSSFKRFGSDSFNDSSIFKSNICFATG